MHLTSSPVDWYVGPRRRRRGVRAPVGERRARARDDREEVDAALAAGSRWKTCTASRGCSTGTFVVIHIVSVAIDSYLAVLDRVARRAAAGLVPARSGPASGSWPPSSSWPSHSRTTTATAASPTDWRKAHYVNFVVWTAATLHGLGSGHGPQHSLAARDLCDRRRHRLRPRSGWRVLGGTTPHRRGRCALRAAGPRRGWPSCWWSGGWPSGRCASRTEVVRGTRPGSRDRLSGKILSDNGVTKGIISMAGNGTGDQPVLRPSRSAGHAPAGGRGPCSRWSTCRAARSAGEP